MLLPNADFENISMQFFRSIQALHIAKILRKANIRKAYGSSAMEIFKFLLLLSFQCKNLWRFLHSKRCELAGVSKNTFYRFLENPSFNWPRFLMMLAYAVIAVFITLTKSTRPKVFILDDSAYGCNRSKNVELLCKFYDHVTHSFLRGFTMPSLGWSDGSSFPQALIFYHLRKRQIAIKRSIKILTIAHAAINFVKQVFLKNHSSIKTFVRCFKKRYIGRLRSYGHMVYNWTIH